MEKKFDLVSIIVPVYNSSEFLEEMIESVVNQTYGKWELILVDDNSSDFSKDIIRGFETDDHRIRGVFLNENKGAGFARNIGIEECKGDFIAFLDSDDIWLPQKLEKQIGLLNANQSINFIYSWYSIIDEEGEESGYFITPSKISFSLLKFNNYILTSSIICRRQVLGSIRFPLMRRRQDWAFFLDILKGTKYATALPEVLVKYRKSKNSLSSNRLKLIGPNMFFFATYFHEGNRILAFIHFLFFLPVYFHNKIFNKKSRK